MRAPSSRHAGSSSASNNFIPCQEQIFSDGEESDGALLHAAAYTEWQSALASSDSIAGGQHEHLKILDDIFQSSNSVYGWSAEQGDASDAVQLIEPRRTELSCMPSWIPYHSYRHMSESAPRTPKFKGLQG